MARKPECGFKIVEEELAELPGANFRHGHWFADESAVHSLFFSRGLEPSQDMLFECRICGPVADIESYVLRCDPTKHAAYYAALERGEIEPIRMDERKEGE